MSYTNSVELLEPSLTKLIEGITEFRAAAEKRTLNAHEWSKGHLVHINDLSYRLNALLLELVDLKESTR